MTDAAGLAIADRFAGQIRGITQAGRNTNDGISLAQTADDTLASIGHNLQRIRELSVQAANATNSSSDRASLQLEVEQLRAEIDRASSQSQFNGVRLLDGSFVAKAIQVGADRGQTTTLPALSSARTDTLGTYQGFSVGLYAGSAASNTAIPLSVAIGGKTIALGSVAADAKELANAINASGIPGLSASLDPQALSFFNSFSSATANGTATYTLNGVAINIDGVAGTAALSTNRKAAVAAINAQSAATGVFAEDNGTQIELRAPDGRNISMAYSAGTFTGSTKQDFGLPAISAPVSNPAILNVRYVAPVGTTGTVTLTHSAQYSSTQQIASQGTALNALDISSVVGANSALASIDIALSTVDSARASLGAVNNRLDAMIGNLQSSGENLAAARGRIQDADFAAETASLSRAQILQGAGTAMIAQANQLPAQVLVLLKA